MALIKRFFLHLRSWILIIDFTIFIFVLNFYLINFAFTLILNYVRDIQYFCQWILYTLYNKIKKLLVWDFFNYKLNLIF